MQRQDKEFDRTFFKTYKSRSIKFALDKSKGFTLIELLVVISIIALLSTVALAMLQDSRVKARNSAKNSLVLEYTKALELYRQDHGNYPISGIPGSYPVCVGYTPTENCFGSRIGSLSINDAFDDYMPGDYAHRTSIISGSSDYRGITYESTTGNTYILRHVLEKQVSKCVYDTTGGTFGANTLCTYTLN